MDHYDKVIALNNQIIKQLEDILKIIKTVGDE